MEFMNCLASGVNLVKETIGQWGFSEGFATIISEIKNPTFVGGLVKLLFDAVGSYGWAVVLFTVLLKVITSPLDFWQRFSMKKNSKMMAELTPMMAKLDKAYANDKQKLNQEKTKLYKKHGYNMMAGCLPMIVTLVIFFIMFGGLNQCSAYVNIKVYSELSEHYTQTLASELNKYQDEFTQKRFDILLSGKSDALDEYKEWLAQQGKDENQFNAEIQAATARISEIKAKAQEEARKAVGDYYVQAKEGFLWITNISRPDTWVESFPETSSKFMGTLTNRYKSYADQFDSELYKEIYQGISEKGVGYKVGKSHWNGLMILPILSIGLSFASTFISNKTSKNKNSQAEQDPSAVAAQSTNKFLMFFMPIMMGVFGFIYTATFALYMVCSSLLSIIFTLAMNPIIDRKVAKIESKVQKPDYRRK